MQTIGLLANTRMASRVNVIHKATAWLRKQGCEYCTDQATADQAGLECKTFQDAASLARACDLLLVFGGDGTILRTARQMRGGTTPLLGINTGSLGFLTAASAHKLEPVLEQVLAGNFTVETRPLIQGTVTHQTKNGPFLALNDFVIGRKSGSRLIELEVLVDGQELTRYRCDGLIICSPTGSTAYSLSAGGAIISPNAEVLTLTPICPHTLSNRSVVISMASEIEVIATCDTPEILVAGDGEPLTDLPKGESVKIKKSRSQVRLARLHGSSFYATLRQKLQWSGAHV